MTLEPIAPKGRRRPAADAAAVAASDAARNADGLVGSAVKVASWATRTGWGIARRLPGGEIAERGLQELERTALSELRKRIDSADAAGRLPYAQAPAPGGAPVITTHGDFAPLRATMAELLQRSLAQSTAEAKQDLYTALLAQLIPDEARILSALSDGSPYALVDVTERAGVNGVGAPLMANASNVGKTAGITLDAEVPTYLTRLIGLGLASRGPEEPELAELAEHYDILLTDPLVRAAMNSAKRTKVLRRTLRISPLGAQLWAASDPSTWQPS